MDEQNTTQQQPTISPFYSNLSKMVFHGESEKSFVDKLLGRQDADKLHELIKKEPLTLSDVEEILFLMTSIDQKLLNYDEWDRYIIVKLFPWVKDFSIICKEMMIYEQSYIDGEFDNDFKTDDEENPEKVIEEKTEKKGKDEEDEKIVLTEEEQKLKKDVIKIIKEINKYLLHDFKFLISTFLLVSNTTLSIDGGAFNVLTTSKFEYSYPTMPMPQPQERRSILNVFKRK